MTKQTFYDPAEVKSNPTAYKLMDHPQGGRGFAFTAEFKAGTNQVYELSSDVGDTISVQTATTISAELVQRDPGKQAMLMAAATMQTSSSSTTTLHSSPSEKSSSSSILSSCGEFIRLEPMQSSVHDTSTGPKGKKGRTKGSKRKLTAEAETQTTSKPVSISLTFKPIELSAATRAAQSVLGSQLLDNLMELGAIIMTPEQFSLLAGITPGMLQELIKCRNSIPIQEVEEEPTWITGLTKMVPVEGLPEIRKFFTNLQQQVVNFIMSSKDSRYNAPWLNVWNAALVSQPGSGPQAPHVDAVHEFLVSIFYLSPAPRTVFFPTGHHRTQWPELPVDKNGNVNVSDIQQSKDGKASDPNWLKLFQSLPPMPSSMDEEAFNALRDPALKVDEGFFQLCFSTACHAGAWNDPAIYTKDIVKEINYWGREGDPPPDTDFQLRTYEQVLYAHGYEAARVVERKENQAEKVLHDAMSKLYPSEEFPRTKPSSFQRDGVVASYRQNEKQHKKGKK